MEKDYILIAGPCSAETRQQVVGTAQALLPIAQQMEAQGWQVLFRAGLWKPRTNPDTFCGVGEEGLAWLADVQQMGLRVCTEVATAEHVALCLANKIDALWIGARTVSDPFAMQAVADALHGHDIPVFVKNPISNDPQLWAGAIQRLQKAGIRQIGAVLRGTAHPASLSDNFPTRNAPNWTSCQTLRQQFPNMPILCDPSHIAGDSKLVPTIAQQGIHLGLNGLMIEVHPQPAQALTDARQQLTPAELQQLLAQLTITTSDTADTTMQQLRAQIDEIDDQLWTLIAERNRVARQIGEHKKAHRLPVLQSDRFQQIVQHRIEQATALGLRPDYVRQLIELLHEESVRQQL